MRFILAFCLAGAVFGDVGVSLFVAGAAFREILEDSRSAKSCIFPYKMRLQDGTSIRSPKRRVRDDHFIFGYVRICLDHVGIMVGAWSNRLYIGGSNSGKSQNFVAGAVFGDVGR